MTSTMRKRPLLLVKFNKTLTGSSLESLSGSEQQYEKRLGKSSLGSLSRTFDNRPFLSCCEPHYKGKLSAKYLLLKLVFIRMQTLLILISKALQLASLSQ